MTRRLRSFRPGTRVIIDGHYNPRGIFQVVSTLGSMHKLRSELGGPDVEMHRRELIRFNPEVQWHRDYEQYWTAERIGLNPQPGDEVKVVSESSVYCGRLGLVEGTVPAEGAKLFSVTVADETERYEGPTTNFARHEIALYRKAESPHA